MTDKRVVILENGQVTIGGVVCKLAPTSPTPKMNNDGAYLYLETLNASGINSVAADQCYRAMLSAAAIDLSSLPRAPERRVSIDINGGNGWAQWNAALDAMGIK